MFVSYDIRGIYPKEFNEKVVCFLVEKFYQFLKRKKINTNIFLAIDPRKSSISLANAFANYYLNFSKVEYLGILPIPIFYYKCLKEKRAGAMITASHLPQNFNGIKFFLPDGESWIYKGKIKQKEVKLKNNIVYKNILLENIYKEYASELKKFYKLKKKHYINFDERKKTANQFLFKTLSKIEPKIKFNEKSDIKIFSDFDGDRLWIKYKNNQLLPEHILYAILKSGYYKNIGIPLNISKKILSSFPNLNFFFIPTGHSNFKKAFHKYKLDFAFEPTFHYYFFKEIKTECPLLGFLRFLEYIEKFSFESLLKNDFYVKRIYIKGKLNILKISNFLKKEKFKLKKFDGLNFRKIEKEDYFIVHIRKSKTEKDTFRIFLESSSKNNLKLLYNLIKKFLK